MGWLNDYPNAASWNEFPWLARLPRRRPPALCRHGLPPGGRSASPPPAAVRLRTSRARFARPAQQGHLRHNHAAHAQLPIPARRVGKLRSFADRQRSPSPSHRARGTAGAVLPTAFPRSPTVTCSSTCASPSRTSSSWVTPGSASFTAVTSMPRRMDLAQAGYLIEQSHLPAGDRIPVLFLERFKEGRPPLSTNGCRNTNPMPFSASTPSCRDWLEELGLNAPRGHRPRQPEPGLRRFRTGVAWTNSTRKSAPPPWTSWWVRSAATNWACRPNPAVSSSPANGYILGSTRRAPASQQEVSALTRR